MQLTSINHSLKDEEMPKSIHPLSTGWELRSFQLSIITLWGRCRVHLDIESGYSDSPCKACAKTLGLNYNAQVDKFWTPTDPQPPFFPAVSSYPLANHPCNASRSQPFCKRQEHNELEMFLFICHALSWICLVPTPGSLIVSVVHFISW